MNLKEKWQHASLREKQIISLTGIILGILIIYLRTLAPLTNTVSEMKTTIQDNQSLLLWMQNSDKRIKQLSQTTQSDTIQSTAALLNVLQTEITNTVLENKVVQLQQADNDTVQLRLQKASFDAIIQWLTKLSQTHKLVITLANFTKEPTSGTVDADIKISL